MKEHSEHQVFGYAGSRRHPVERVGAAISNHIDVSAKSASELCLPAGCHDLKFADHIEAVESPD